jgi:peptidyl-prolyl cis-trans isomerase SurA|tara:strand:+ start:659 stop:1900 length:1242 start_codon:yes stop_codon:yes gene_type:complete
MKKFTLLTTFFLSSSLFSAIEILDRVAVIVEDGLIMESQIKRDLEDMIKRYDEQNIPKPDNSILREQVIESLIIEELQLQLADRYGIRISDEELNNTISRIAANNNYQLEEFIKFIENDGSSYVDFRENVKKQITIQRVQRGRVGSEIDITEKEFEAFLETNESLSELEPELLVRQILVKDINKANEIYGKIQNGVSFESIAQSEPSNTYKNNNGLMEWRKAIDMPELFSKAINLKPLGFVSKPIKSGAGYHILKLEEQRGRFVKNEDQWSARHILLIPSTIRDDEATIQELENIRQKIIDGENFAKMANDYSEDPGSAKSGGELGWYGKGVFAAEFEKVMVEIEPNVISEIFETEFGYHFLEVIDKRNYDMTRDIIRDEAYQILYERKFNEELENTLRAIRAEAFVEFKELD